jgi:hypothetical protein
LEFAEYDRIIRDHAPALAAGDILNAIKTEAGDIPKAANLFTSVDGAKLQTSMRCLFKIKSNSVYELFNYKF